MEIRIPFERRDDEEENNEPLSPGEINGIRAFFGMCLRDPDLVYRFGQVQVITDDAPPPAGPSHCGDSDGWDVPPENRIT